MPEETMKERTARLCADPNTMDTITGHLANGGNLIDLCKTWNVRYSDIVTFLNADAERKKSYMSALDARNEFCVQRILSELNALAFMDLSKVFDDDHKLLPPSKWPPDVCRAIAGIDVEDLDDYEDGKKVRIGYTKKLKVYDKLKSIELLGKDLGRFVSKHEVSGRLTLEDLVTGSNKPE